MTEKNWDAVFYTFIAGVVAIASGVIFGREFELSREATAMIATLVYFVVRGSL